VPKCTILNAKVKYAVSDCAIALGSTLVETVLL